MGSKGARHGKAADRWNGSPRPSRAAQLAQAANDTAQRPHGRKDTKRWCRGKTGTEHEATLTTEPLGWPDGRCGWCKWLPTFWACHHRIKCSRCGKILKRLLREDCPEFAAQLALVRDGKFRSKAWGAYLAANPIRPAADSGQDP